LETIDFYGYHGKPSLAFDGNGRPSVSYCYYDASNVDLKYAYRDAFGWHIQTLYVPIIASSCGYTSLAMDGGGFAHVSYYSGNHSLGYVHQHASGWQSGEIVDDQAYVGMYTSLGLDGDGYPYISYYDDDNDDLKYAFRNASGWQVQTLDGMGGWCQYTSLALDGSGNPHINYCAETTNDLMYAYHDAYGWHTQIVDR